MDGVPVAVSPWKGAPELAQAYPQHDLATVTALATVRDFEDALATIQPVVETAIDALAFQMQAALHVVAVHLIDVTGPLVVGEERASRTDGNSDALISPKFSPPGMNFAWQEFSHEVPDLRLGRFPSDGSTRMALWWYVKSLDVPYVVDKFVCLWTATEILLSASGVQVEAPYVAPCSHTVGECPECGRSLTRMVRGASLKTFLEEQAGVFRADADDMWNLRQVVHGKSAFTAERLAAMTRLGGVLRAAVLVLLKTAMNDPLDTAPVLVPTGGAIMGTMVALRGTRPLDQDDIDTVAFLDSL